MARPYTQGHPQATRLMWNQLHCARLYQCDLQIHVIFIKMSSSRMSALLLFTYSLRRLSVSLMCIPQPGHIFLVLSCFKREASYFIGDAMQKLLEMQSSLQDLILHIEGDAL
jgi:hypothetical protein